MNVQHHEMKKKLKQLKEMDSQLLQLVMSKPNISDDFEMEGEITPVTMPPAIDKELQQIDKMLSE